jgi:hypothetical protein
LLLPRLVSLRGLLVVAVVFFPAAVSIFVMPPSPLIALILAAALILTRLVMGVPPLSAVLAPRLIFDDDRPDLPTLRSLGSHIWVVATETVLSGHLFQSDWCSMADSTEGSVVAMLTEVAETCRSWYGWCVSGCCEEGLSWDMVVILIEDQRPDHGVSDESE